MDHQTASLARPWPRSPALAVFALWTACAAGCDDVPRPAPPSRLPSVDPVVPRPTPSPSRDFVRAGSEFVHGPARIRVRVPDAWRVVEGPADRAAIASLRLAGPGDEQVTLSIAPLERDRTLDEVAASQARALRLPGLYGPDRVAEPVRVVFGGKPAWRIDIAPKQGSDDRESMWFFKSHAEPDSPWRLKLRATLPAGASGEAVESLAAAIELEDQSPRPPAAAARKKN